MKVGVQLPEVEREVRWPELADMAQLIEEVGFDSIWVGDHLLYRVPGRGERGPWEAWTQMAGLAAITERVEIGPLVAATSFHAPAMLAKKAATIDEISNGRFILGLGAGWNDVEYRAFGFPFDRRVSRFEEAFEIIRRLVAGERLDFAGEFYEVSDSILLPPSRRTNGPPILIGSQGPRMLRITAPHMDMWNAWYAWYGNDPAGLEPLIAQVDAALGEAGRDPGEVLKTAAVLVGLDGSVGRPAAHPRLEAEPLRGSPQQVASALARWQDQGIGHLQLVLDPITLESIERLAPMLEHFRRLTGERAGE